MVQGSVPRRPCHATCHLPATSTGLAVLEADAFSPFCAAVCAAAGREKSATDTSNSKTEAKRWRLKTNSYFQIWNAKAVVQFDKEASQTRDHCVARTATQRGSPKSFAAQTTLAQDDNQSAPLPMPRNNQENGGAKIRIFRQC